MYFKDEISRGKAIYTSQFHTTKIKDSDYLYSFHDQFVFQIMPNREAQNSI